MNRTYFFTLIFIGLFSLTDFIGLQNSYADEEKEDPNAKNVVTKIVKVKSKKGIVTFEIHGMEKELPYMERVATILREDVPDILEYFRYKPTTNINIRLNSSATSANGSATVFPRNSIELQTFPPLGKSHLNGKGDWVKGLVLHEVVHILHLDQTDGWMDVLRSIFGSFAKLGGIIPRWFSEGLAVWAETEFTLGGRLRSKLNNFETNSVWLDKNFCKEIDCISNPGHYPSYSLSYWIGGQFLEWIEEQKAGTLRCLVQTHSSAIPLFINQTFETCTGSNALVNFKKFRKEKYQNLRKEQKLLAKSAFLKQNFRKLSLKDKDETRPSYQKGMSLYKGNLLYVESNDRWSNLVSYNLVENKKNKVSYNGGVRFVGENKFGFGVPIVTSDSSVSSDQRNIKVFDPKNKMLKEIELEKGGDYPFSLGQNDTVYFHHNKLAWSLRRKNRTGERELIRFPKLWEITNPKLLVENKRAFLSFTVFDYREKKPHQVWSYTFKNKKLEKLYESSRSVELLESCKSEQIFRKSDKELLFLNKNGSKVTQKTLNVSWAGQVVGLTWSNDDTVVLLKDDPEHIYYLDRGCKEIVKELKREVHSSRKIATKEFVKKKDVSTSFDSNFPDAHHYLPHYWTIGYLSGDSASLLSASTSINDPKDLHSLSLTGKYYTNLSEGTGDLIYAYDWDSYYLSLAYVNSFTKSSLKTTPDENTIKQASVSHKFESGYLKYNARVGLSKESITDFISSRDDNVYFSGNKFSFLAPKYKNFFQHLGVTANFDWHNVKGSKEFLELNSKFNFSLRPFNNLLTHFKMTYGKMDKKTLSSGAIFGGGANDLDSSAFHDFYGLSTNDAFGNEVVTARFQFDYEFYRIFKGHDLAPIYFSKFNMVAGMDYIKTDYIYIKPDKGFIRNKDLKSMHAGLKVKGDIFYNAPVEVDLLYVQNLNDHGSNESQTLVLFKGQFFP